MRALTYLAREYDEEIASLAPQKVIKQVILQLQSSSTEQVFDAVECLGSFFVSEESLIVDNAINLGFFTHVVNIFKMSKDPQFLRAVLFCLSNIACDSKE